MDQTWHTPSVDANEIEMKKESNFLTVLLVIDSRSDSAYAENRAEARIHGRTIS